MKQSLHYVIITANLRLCFMKIYQQQYRWSLKPTTECCLKYSHQKKLLLFSSGGCSYDQIVH